MAVIDIFVPFSIQRFSFISKQLNYNNYYYNTKQTLNVVNLYFHSFVIVLSVAIIVQDKYCPVTNIRYFISNCFLTFGISDFGVFAVTIRF